MKDSRVAQYVKDEVLLIGSKQEVILAEKLNNSPTNVNLYNSKNLFYYLFFPFILKKIFSFLLLLLSNITNKE